MLHLQIYGYLWSGPRAVYQYTIPAPITSDIEAKRHAGDFESLIDWRLVSESNAYEDTGHGLSRRIDTFKTLRGFRNGMTPRRFDRLANQ